MLSLDFGQDVCLIEKQRSISRRRTSRARDPRIRTRAPRASRIFSHGWLLGRLTQASVESGALGASDLTRTSGFSYDPNTGLLLTEVVEPGASDSSNLKVTTTYAYDSFGNKHLVTVAGSGGVAPCKTETDYDAHGQFPTRVTNCLGESESYAYDAPFSAAFGLAHSHTGPNGLTTTWAYDSFGRKTQETRPDGTYTTVSYTYCAGANGGAAACPVNPGDPAHASALAFTTSTSTKGSDGSQIAPDTHGYYDGLSRGVVGDVQGFAGTLIRSDTLYDKWGWVWKKDRPYFVPATGTINPCTDGNTVCTQFSTDDLGRVTKALQPDGGYTQTYYQGLTTKTRLHIVHHDGSLADQYSWTTKNDLGVPSQVEDTTGGTTNYTYDALGELLTVTDPASHVVTTNHYDQRGRKDSSTDLDLGHWTYVYNSLGQLIGQTDLNAAHNGTTVTLRYDALGRMIARNEPDMATVWTYGTSATSHNIDKLASVSCTGTACGTGGASGSYSRTYLYDALGRQVKLTTVVGTSSYYTTTAYDSVSGKMTDTRAFSGFTLHYAYNTWGYQNEIDDGGNFAIAYWKANTRDAEMHLTQQTAYNGVVTSQNFDALSGRVIAINAGVNNAVASLGFDWDTAGNLADRTDTHASGWQTENFCYDALNRLTNSNFGTSCTGGSTVAYDATGNITSKSDVGTYTYGTNVTAGAGPHALASVSGTANGVPNPTFTYDLAGNMTSGAGRTVTYTTFNMTKTMTNGGASLALTYDVDHSRLVQTTGTGSAAITTTYLNDPASNVMTEGLHQTGLNTWKTYIVADGHIVAQRSTYSGGGQNIPANNVRYFVLDHLGSVAVITDETGAVVTTGRQFYDAWGKERNPDGTADTTCSLPAQSQSTRGFTNQEEMPSVCLINFNARLYDPQVGRFMGADGAVEAPYSTQDWNRYTYVGNNPLSFTDPSGQCFLGCFWNNGIGREIIGIAVGILLEQVWALPSLFANTAYSAAEIGFATAGIAGGVSGAISTGKLSGAFLGALEAVTFYQVGSSLEDPNNVVTAFGSHTVAAIFAHGMVGGLFSLGQKGGFVAGFLAAGFGSLADSPEFDTGSKYFGNVLVHAALGGLGSMLGGGKFENGAVTEAFGYVAESIASPDAPDFSAGKISGGVGSGSSVAEFMIDKENFEVFGAMYMDQVSLIQEDLISIFGTPRGAQMLASLESRPNLTFGIDLTEVGVDNSDHPGPSNLIHIDPLRHPIVQTTAGPEAAGMLRILSHEIGHAAFGTLDDGPGKMNNVRQNENPLMRALGYPARTTY
jgi:RHS repeat-associated protein